VVTLLVAVAGAAVSIVVTSHRNGSGGSTLVASTTTTQSTTTPAAPPATTTTPVVTHQSTTTTTTKAPRNGRTLWPAGARGWTIVLGSYPVTTGKTAALASADRAARSDLPDVGLLDSSNYASLHPGYYVVFSGMYASEAEAQAALKIASASGFAGAYPREISR
jgi:hypothetical protein